MSEATDGFRLAYDRGGAGPPVLLLHGWPGDRRDYRDVTPRLTGLDVVAPDLRGRGHGNDAARPVTRAGQPRPIKGIFVAVMVRNCTWASRGRPAM
jgi:pimeloyl-ACP methyl ester carboxylesterase